MLNKVHYLLIFVFLTSQSYAQTIVFPSPGEPQPLHLNQPLFGPPRASDVIPVGSLENQVDSLQKQKNYLKQQLDDVSQRLEALHQFIGAQKALNLKWVKSANGQTAPDALSINFNGQTVQICHAAFLTGTHPGILKSGGCLITYGGYSAIIQTYEVLVGKTNIQWTKVDSISNYQLPLRDTKVWQAKFIPIQGGFENGNPLYLCKATYNNNVYLGKVIGDNCDFAYGPQEIYTKDFQVLFGEKI